MSVKTEEVIVKVKDGSEMQVYVARPEAKVAPGILIFQEAFGVNAHIKDVARRFAELGYVAAAPELFHRTAPRGYEGSYSDFAEVRPHFEAINTQTLEDDASASYRWLDEDEQCDSPRIGCIGFCLGGRVSFITNSILPLKAAVSFYGGGIAQNLLGLAPKQHAPILFFWGGLDQHITADLRNSVAEAMTTAEKTYINVEFSKANHAFFCDARPAYHPESAKEAWALIKEFLEANL